MIRLAAVAEVDAIWPKIAAGMEECCRRSGSDITPDWLFFACRKGEAMLVVVEDGDEIAGALIAASQYWGGRRVLRILALCGHDMASWLDELRAIKPLLGIEKVIFEGRAGWSRVPGVRELRRVYEADLEGARAFDPSDKLGAEGGETPPLRRTTS
jgi:hypothetical protein